VQDDEQVLLKGIYRGLGIHLREYIRQLIITCKIMTRTMNKIFMV
jgi:hypothetical protein